MDTLWTAITVLSTLGFSFGIVLGCTAQYFQVEDNSISELIDNILPQSQCGQCGYNGCRPYAEAIANGEMINRCVPGGEQVMLKLADFLNLDPQPLGKDIPVESTRKIAYIDEANCIGCTKCIKACPVDAIVGSARFMHTVIEDICTGCTLCVAPCPTDCIVMRVVSTTPDNWKWDMNLIPVQVIHVQDKDV